MAKRLSAVCSIVSVKSVLNCFYLCEAFCWAKTNQLLYICVVYLLVSNVINGGFEIGQLAPVLGLFLLSPISGTNKGHSLGTHSN